jgi:hypothetical protein
VRQPPQPAERRSEAANSAAPKTSSRSAFQLTFWDAKPPAPPAPAPSRPEVSERLVESARQLAPLPPAPFSPRPIPDAADSFARTYRRLRLAQPAPSFRVAFRHFTGLRSAIRIKDPSVIEAQLSDLLQEAPPIVIDAIAEILITRLFRRRTSREANECYKAWAASARVAQRVEEIRRTRGRKRLVHPQGDHFNLRAIFDDLNARFFAGRIQVTRIGWSPKRSRRMLGHYDSSHRTITVTRWLDGRKVPRYVVEYLVYHEMLHAQFPVERRNQRRIVHSKAFREAERSFPDYERAARWLKGGWRTKGSQHEAAPGVIDSSF